LEDNLIFEPWAEEHFKHNSECWDKTKEMEKEQERMYSEEEVLEILESFNNGLSREEQLNDKAILSHLEQFKKK
jgi:hypothetical protein